MTDIGLQKLSRMMTDTEELRFLAIYGLKMEQHLVTRHLQNHQNDITGAAYKILSQWRTSQTNDTTAYKNLQQALLDNNMKYFIENALLKK